MNIGIIEEIKKDFKKIINDLLDELSYELDIIPNEQLSQAEKNILIKIKYFKNLIKDL